MRKARPLTLINVAFDKHGSVDTTGLAVCTRTELLATAGLGQTRDRGTFLRHCTVRD